jgi:hypothetical protein
LAVLILFIVSCNSKNGRKVVSSDFVQTENNKTAYSQQPQPDISNVSKKMQKQEKLTSPDYDCICGFLFNNSDESKSEEIGYQLFEYLKNNQLNNTAFLSYLNGKDTKEKVIKSLIQIMCIDIGEEKYTYDTFIKDFEMFSNSISAKNAFNECMRNQ